MTLKLLAKVVYGPIRYYPNCQLSHFLLELFQRKAFSSEQVMMMKDMGWNLQVEEKAL